jgi:uncharacterized protein
MSAPTRHPKLARAFGGKWALVTGASSGLGEHIALDLAASGAHLVLTARRADRLEDLAARIRASYFVQTRVIPADLSLPEAPQQLYDATEAAGTPIDILINNAGFGYLGHFQAGPPEWDRKMVDVNCAAVVHLTHLFLPRMIERRHGYIMMLASAASFQPIPYMSTYAATKAFDRFLGEALDAEVRQYGIRVSSLCPGPTESEFGQVAGLNSSALRRVQAVDPVIRTGLLDLAKGRPISYPPGSNAFFFFLERFLPRSLVTRALERGLRSAIPNRNP